MRFWLGIFTILAAVYYYMYGMPSLVTKTHSPGVLVAESPLQRYTNKRPWQHNGYKISPVYEYSVKARILHTSRYNMDRESDLVPVDLALGWQEMSDSSLLDKIDVSQRSRWYHLRWYEQLPISEREVFVRSANTHVIPANGTVKKQLLSLEEGDVVQLVGYLVNANAKDGWNWRSSTTRHDTGDGSCELMWVEKVQALK